MKKEKLNLGKNDKENDTDRVNRGGSYFNIAWGSRVSLRDRYLASGRNSFLGFRLVLQTKEKK